MIGLIFSIILHIFPRFSKRDRCIHWGKEFPKIPQRFADLLVEAVRKKFRVGHTEAMKKVHGGMNEARIKARARLRVRSHLNLNGTDADLNSFRRILFSGCAGSPEPALSTK